LLRSARNDPLYDDQTITLQQAAGNYQVKRKRSFTIVLKNEGFTREFIAIFLGLRVTGKHIDTPKRMLII
jgi:hypothetical protein